MQQKIYYVYGINRIIVDFNERKVFFNKTLDSMKHNFLGTANVKVKFIKHQ